VVEGPQRRPVQVKDGQFSPPEISADLQKLKRDAEAFLGTEVTEAVITGRRTSTMPAAATKDAGSSPAWRSADRERATAASLAYGLDKEMSRPCWYSTWRGTFDVFHPGAGDGVFRGQIVERATPTSAVTTSTKP